LVEVRLLAGLRELVGAAELDVPARAVREVLEGLAERGGPELEAMLFAADGRGAGALHRDLRVLVNGRSIEFLAGVETELREDDAVTLHLAGARGFPGG
jgi:molybdopterin converting factor small subunit